MQCQHVDGGSQRHRLLIHGRDGDANGFDEMTFQPLQCGVVDGLNANLAVCCRLQCQGQARLAGQPVSNQEHCRTPGEHRHHEQAQPPAHPLG